MPDIVGDLVPGAQPFDDLGRTASPQAGELKLLVADIRVNAALREGRGVGHVPP